MKSEDENTAGKIANQDGHTAEGNPDSGLEKEPSRIKPERVQSRIKPERVQSRIKPERVQSRIKPERVQQLLMAVPNWVLDDSGDSVLREYHLPNYPCVLAFVALVGEIAQAREHYPNVLVKGKTSVTLTLTTISVGGISGADISLAAAIDGVSDPVTGVHPVGPV